MLMSLRWCAALMATFFTGTMLATLHPAPGSFAITGDYLYLRPTLDDTIFVVASPAVSTSTRIGEAIGNPFEYKSGFRVGAAYGFCECGDLQIKYTNLSSKHTKFVSGTVLSATRGLPGTRGIAAFQNYNGTATSNLHLLYERGDISFAQLAFDWNRLETYLQFGVEAAFIKLKEEQFYDEFSPRFNTLVVDERSRTWGVGPQIGLEFDYRLVEFSDNFPGTLSLNFFASSSLLVGVNQLRQIDILNGTTNTDLRSASKTILIPALHSGVSMKFETCFSGIGDYLFSNSIYSLFSHMGLSLEVGYEFNAYFKGLTRMTFLARTVESQVIKTPYNFNLQGLYISAMVSF